MKVPKTKPVKFTEGKYYKLKISGFYKPTRIHIDKIMKNPCYSPRESWIENAEDLIVYRVWSNRRGWKWYVSAYWEFCLFNDWVYELPS